MGGAGEFPTERSWTCAAVGSFASQEKSGDASTRGRGIWRRKATEKVERADMSSSTGGEKIHFHLLSSLGKSRDPRLPKPRPLLSVSKLFISLS